MKPTSESSTQEVLAGLVERVTFHNAENGFCVLRSKARSMHNGCLTRSYLAVEWSVTIALWPVRPLGPGGVAR